MSTSPQIETLTKFVHEMYKPNRYPERYPPRTLNTTFVTSLQRYLLFKRKGSAATKSLLT